jgi:hypothetical protein
MKKITIKAFMLIAAGLLTFTVNAQEKTKVKKLKSNEVVKCATVEYENLLQKRNAIRPSKERFENWIASKIEAQKAQRTAQRPNEIVTIPVVVHVIHNGDAIGSNENITDGQILSQLTVLNQDFSRESGTNGHNDNPVGASMEIAFCMAQQDPFGLASSGIVRYSLGSDQPWEMDELELIKAQTQWDPEKYLNIWVVNQITVSGIYELAGYAQFPIDSGLDGLDQGSGTAAATDGVAIGYLYFGSEEIYPAGSYSENRNLGRTTSHEIGHFFGLRHIWGDENSCTADDYCADTPIAFTANSGCPEEGFDSCEENPGTDMFRNYMDYTDDFCQNIFTIDQKERMQAVLANSPRRHSLLTANSCMPGLRYDNDGSLSIQSLINSCNAESLPSVILANPGTNTITSATFSYAVDTDTVTTYNWTGSLATGEETTIVLPAITAQSGDHTFNVSLLSVNGIEDQGSTNNTKIQDFNVITRFNASQIIITVATDDYGDETLWLLQDSAGELIATNLNIDGSEEIEFYDDNTVYTQTINITESGCYNFTILDFGGDGICCSNGNGYYNIKTADDELIISGGEFSDTDSQTFSINAILNTDSFSTMTGVTRLYPNPSHNIINIAVPQAATLPEAYSVYNNLGQVVNTGKINSNNHELNISGYANGVYFIKLNGGGSTQTLQFIKY